ncbi:OLC1v1024978C1 [Oldenlandia corymbosa var. corymbosa]|uniref:OLC1v1024978C1 n=1 Tax=Oldenlandia corymbosa var. corymbosa TaxID=529605 RepID=A0AAV1C4D4_OLDCO|nr:OLC1v1024978C1 [Oldenlandia corymbosa var. corymbosa]
MGIPSEILGKICAYNIEIGGVKVKASLVRRGDLLHEGLSELKSLVDSNMPLVGVDFKQVKDKNLKSPAWRASAVFSAIRELKSGIWLLWVLKDPSILKCGDLAKVASKIGFEMKEVDQRNEPADWEALVFS